MVGVRLLQLLLLACIYQTTIAQRCVDYAEYSRYFAYGYARCRARIEIEPVRPEASPPVVAPLYLGENVTHIGYSIPIMSDDELLSMWGYDPRECQEHMSMFATDRDAWAKGDCQDAVLDFCCWNQYPRCESGMPVGGNSNNTKSACHASCRAVQDACKFSVHFTPSSVFSGSTQEMNCEMALASGSLAREDCTGTANYSSGSIVTVFYTVVVALAIFVTLI